MTTTQPDLFSPRPVKPNFTACHFNGSNYEPKLDDARLRGQIKRIYEVMKDGKWRTLGEIEALTGDPPASISAQLRHLRKARFGGFEVNKQQRGLREGGLFEYQVLTP